MTTATLALLIALAILIQLVTGLVVWYKSQQARHDNLATSLEVSEQAIQKSSTVLNPNSHWQGFRSFTVVRRADENHTKDICSFYLAPSEPMTLPGFKPGQFLTFQFDLPKESGETRKLQRCYSLSDHPNSEYYRISVKREPEGVVSNYLHDRIHEGDTLMVKAPSGHFHLIEDPSLPRVLIAGGIGITPMLSILLTLLKQESERQIWLFYGVRNGREVIMHDQLISLADYHSQFHLHICYSQPQAGDRLDIDYQHSGRVDIPLLQSILPLAHYQFYICSPGALMETIVPGLESIGIASDDIHYEAFGPATLKRPRESTQSEDQNWQVKFTRSGRSSVWSEHHDTLLDMAEAEGIEVESSCRAGSCGSCQSCIERGEVEYLQPPVADVAVNHCLLCISRPKTNLELAV
jgi:ferredoxin-NADP reductase